MPRRTLSALLEAIDILREKGYTDKSHIEWKIIDLAIKQKVGSSWQTLRDVKTLINDFELMTPIKDDLWQVNFEKAAELAF